MPSEFLKSIDITMTALEGRRLLFLDNIMAVRKQNKEEHSCLVKNGLQKLNQNYLRINLAEFPCTNAKSKYLGNSLTLGYD